jgi:hypothetical protein
MVGWILAVIGIKLPGVAVNHFEQFFDYTCNSKDMSLAGLLNVSNEGLLVEVLSLLTILF